MLRCTKKNPPAGATGQVAIKFLWPPSTAKRAFKQLGTQHGAACTFTLTGKGVRRCSSNKESMCYIGTVPECTEYNSDDLKEMWVVMKYFKCDALTAAQKQLTPIAVDDVLVVDAAPDGITSSTIATAVAGTAENGQPAGVMVWTPRVTRMSSSTRSRWRCVTID
jgi:hypothetical protein